MKLELTRGFSADVDPSDFERLSKFSWSAVRKNGKLYARRSGGVCLHQDILPAVPGKEIDHRDGNGLNNRRKNLRYATHHQNQMSMSRHRDGSSRYKGVFWFKRDCCWAAQICFRGKRIHLGYFQHETEAARAYDKRAKELHGKFAKTNF